MSGKSGSASSNVLDILPFEKWGEKLAEQTVTQVRTRRDLSASRLQRLAEPFPLAAG